MRPRCQAGKVGGAMPPTHPPQAATAPAMLRVWDPVVRLFHWGLVALFVTAYATSELGGLAHGAAGYGILGLLVVRVIWGFVGPRHARFSDFVRPPAVVWSCLKRVARRRAPRNIGHNLAGGVMVLALIAVLSGIGITGHLLTTTAWWGTEWLEDLHEAPVNLAPGLIALHLLGGLVTGLMHRENLMLAMITGRKRAD